MKHFRLLTSSPRSRRLLGGTIAAIGVCAAVLSMGVSAQALAEPIEVDVLTINDFHGRIEANGAAAGAAVLAGAVNEYRKRNPETLVVSAGDNIGASTFTSFIQQDKPTLDILNTIGLDASAVGNHEFDRGRDDFTQRVERLSRFPYLAANIYDSSTGQPALGQYAVRQRNGVSIAFIGATTEELPSLVSPSGFAGLEVRDIPTEVNRVAATLRDGDPFNGEADAIILLVHEGAATPAVADSTGDSPFARIVNGLSTDVHAIVSAHTHQKYDHQLRGRPVIQAAKYGENFGHLQLSFDSHSRRLVSAQGNVLLLTNAGQPLYPADGAISAMVKDATAYANELGAQKVGSITENIARAHQADGSENRGGSSTLSNLVADTHLWATRDLGTQIAFMNPGGVRSDLVYDRATQGTVSYRSVAGIQPYANTLVTMTLTGEQIRQVLEQQWQPEHASRSFLKLGTSQGFSYIVDPSAPRGAHVTHMSLGGEPVVATQSYKVVANAFLASGGDNFVTFAEGTSRADSGRADLQAMVDYFADNKLVAPDHARRSIGFRTVCDSPAVSATSALGGPVVIPSNGSCAIELSGLVYSTSVLSSPNVSMELGTELNVSTPIDVSIVDGVDDTGRATVKMPVSDETRGHYTLVVLIPETGTRFDVPVIIE